MLATAAGTQETSSAAEINNSKFSSSRDKQEHAETC